MYSKSNNICYNNITHFGKLTSTSSATAVYHISASSVYHLRGYFYLNVKIILDTITQLVMKGYVFSM